MTIANGLISSLTVDGDDISEDVMSLGLQTPNGLIDVSTLDLVGFQRIIGRRDCSLQLTTRVSDAVAGAHAVLSPATSTVVSGAVVITFAAGPVLTFGGIVGNYDVNVGQDLALTATSTISMNNGVAAVWS